MKQRNKLSLNIVKVLFVMCTLYSQLSFPLAVLADEVTNSNDSEVVSNENNNDNQSTVDEETKKEVTNEKNNNNNENNNEEFTDEENNNTRDELNDEENNNTEEEENTKEEQNNTEEENTKEDNEDNNEEKDNQEETKEEETIQYSIDDTNNTITVYGTLKSNLTKESLKKALGSEYDDANIIDEEGNSIENTSTVKDGMSLSTNSKQYLVKVIGDINKDGIVDKSDLDKIIEEMLNNADNEYTLNDLTYITSAINNGNWLSSTPKNDTLEATISSPSNVLIDEEVVIKFSLDGFKEDSINGITGSFKYDKELLELTKVEATDSLAGNYNDKNEFAYSFSKDKNTDSEVLITLTFKALKEGEATVSLDNLKVSGNGTEASLSENYVEGTITISTAGKGGDDDTQDNTTENNNQEETKEVVEQPTTPPQPKEEKVGVINVVNVPKSNYARQIVLSSNNYINSLTIEGYEIDFDMYTYEYNIKVKHNINSLDINVILDSDYASYIIKGNEKFKDGNNKVEIVVTAEDGSERTYTINVERTKESKTIKTDGKKEKNNNASKTVIIILIILVIIGLIYVIFKDDEEDEVVVEPKKNNTSNKDNSTNKKTTTNKKK